jgi:ribose transport system substrate-binding protein
MIIMKGRIMWGKKAVIICSILIWAIMLSGCYKQKDSRASDDRKTIEFIVKMKSGEHWNLVKQGVREAASEFDVNVNFMAPDEETDVYQQEILVNNAIDNKVDAIVLAASDYREMASIVEKANENKIPVITIDSGVSTDKVLSKVSTNNFESGVQAAEKLVQLTGENSKLAILSFVKGSESAQKREEGVLEALSKYPGVQVVAKEYCYSSESLAALQTRNILSLYDNIDGIVALNSSASLGAAQAIEELGLIGKVKLITFDSTMLGIQHLEKGTIQATVIQNPVAMGYLGVKYAVMAAEGERIPEYINIESKLIDKNSMYLEENQRLIFPFIK